MHIHIGDQVTIVHKDFVAICEVVQVRAPSSLGEHACCQAQDQCDCECQPVLVGPPQSTLHAHYEQCMSLPTEIDPITNKTVIQVIRAAPRGE